MRASLRASAGQLQPVFSGLQRRAGDAGESLSQSEKAAHVSRFWLEKAEGEGFEPSIRLTTDNGFRDRQESVDLQGV